MYSVTEVHDTTGAKMLLCDVQGAVNEARVTLSEEPGTPQSVSAKGEGVSRLKG